MPHKLGENEGSTFTNKKQVCQFDSDYLIGMKNTF